MGLNEGVYASLIDVATGTWTGQVRDPGGLRGEPVPLRDGQRAGPPSGGGGAARGRRRHRARRGRGPAGRRRGTVGTLLQGSIPSPSPRQHPARGPLGRRLAATADPDAGPSSSASAWRAASASGSGPSSFMERAADGSVAAELFTVGGLIDSGSARIDAQLPHHAWRT
ncbi:MAG: hypothetical protein R3F43_02735 [bacterium]